MYLCFSVSYVSEILTAKPQDNKYKEIEPNP